MTSTVACFCGNLYTAPPDRCEVCGRSIEPAAGDGRVMSRERMTLDRWLTAPGAGGRSVVDPPIWT